jgi:uncharacterized membrane-anchored protein
MLHRAVRRLLPFAWMLVASPFLVVPALAQQDEAADPNPFSKIPWTEGPAVGRLGDRAELDVPEGFLFSGAEGTRQFLELTQNIPSGRELGVLLPIPREGDTSGGWFVIFEFADVGYVKDDEKDKLDGEAMLSSIREGMEASNQERKKRGWGTMEVIGWEVPPRYNTETNSLEWAVKFKSDDGESVNLNTRYLGRRGVMRVTLVTDPALFAQAVPEFRSLMQGYSYQSGQKYSEWVQGDKIAKYGLTALVAGGAAAAVAKSGLGKYLGKIILLAFFAVAAFFKRIAAWLKGLFGGKAPPSPPAAG